MVSISSRVNSRCSGLEKARWCQKSREIIVNSESIWDLTCIDKLLAVQLGKDEGLLLGVGIDRLGHQELLDEKLKEPNIFELVLLVPELDQNLVEDGHFAILVVVRAPNSDELVPVLDHIVQGPRFLLILEDFEKELAGGGDPGQSLAQVLNESGGGHDVVGFDGNLGKVSRGWYGSERIEQAATQPNEYQWISS